MYRKMMVDRIMTLSEEEEDDLVFSEEEEELEA